LKILKDQLTTEIDIKDKFSNKNSILNFNKNITIENISFYYDEKIKILNDISFEILKKDKVGIVGSTGSGKSTLVDLFTGLLEIKSGDIKIDGKSIFSNLKKWQQKLGYVSQSIFLLDDTLQNNIIFGSEKELNKDLITKVIKLSKLDNLVSELPNGLNTLIGERGSRISGGQRQRIGIARALYREAEILILDEATSALDYDTETSIMQMIINEYKDKTLIIVSHRDNALKKCNKIFEIKNGLLNIQ
jgi:ABC-type multidrug transport system fused ATPase/permease subunit